MKAPLFRSVLGICTLGWFACAGIVYAQSPASPHKAPQYVPGELLIKFQGGPRGTSAQQARARFNHLVLRNFHSSGWQRIQLPKGVSVEEGLERFRRVPGVEAVAANSILQLSDDNTGSLEHVAPVGAQTGTNPDDPLFVDQWALRAISAPEAWSTSTGSSNVVVAVLDTGVTYDHEDLAANMWRNPGEIPGNGLDDDGNGYVDDVHGIDVVDNDGDPMDGGAPGPRRWSYHGTAVAGIIAAAGNNGRGLSGVNWTVQVMAIRIIGTNDTISLADRLEGFEYVAEMKGRGINIKVTNNSWGGATQPQQAEKDAIDAVGALGILNVCSGGNAGRDTDLLPQYPSSYDSPSIISVAGSDVTDNLWTNNATVGVGSNFGQVSVDLAAPGKDVITTWAFEPEFMGYRTPPGFTGTSAAAPHVAGAVGLLYAINPNASATDIKLALLQSVDRLPAFEGKMVSNGRLNLARAVAHPAVNDQSSPYIFGQPTDLMVNAGGSGEMTVDFYGTGPLDTQWRKNGSILPHATNDVLMLDAVTPSQAGNYDVVVANAFGAVTSRVAVVTVLEPPVVLIPPLSQAVVVGENVTFSIQTTGSLPIGYRWRRGATTLKNEVLHSHTSFLTIENVQPEDTVSYSVILTNAASYRPGVLSAAAGITMLDDADGDGLPDNWETLHGLNPDDATDALGDLDEDGQSNRHEYDSGTDPDDPRSFLQLQRIHANREQGTVVLEFTAAANKTYTLLYSSRLNDATWSRLADVVADATERPIEIEDRVSPAEHDQRYYRLVSPRQP